MGTLWLLDIRSFVGIVPWASHHMAELKYALAEGEYVGEDRKVQVNYVTWSERAKDLSTPDLKTKTGDYTTRFLSHDEAVGASKVVFEHLANEKDLLVSEGDWYNPGIVLAGDPGAVVVLAPIGEQYDKVASFSTYTAEMKALAKQWCDALNDLNIVDPHRYPDNYSTLDPAIKARDDRERAEPAWVQSVDGIWTWIDEDDLPDPHGYKTGSFDLEEPDD